MTHTITKTIDEELAECELFLEWEKQWRDSMPRLTAKQLLDIFPDVKDDLPAIINELETGDRYLKYKIADELFNFNSKYKTEGDRIFARGCLKIGLGQEWLKNLRQLSRLRRLQNLSTGKTFKGQITEQDIQAALEVPIENLYDGKLRKTGKTLTGLCPFHNEKHASFYIYPATNSYYCFGCNNGGNSINFAMNLNGFDFKTAIKFLTNS